MLCLPYGQDKIFASFMPDMPEYVWDISNKYARYTSYTPDTYMRYTQTQDITEMCQRNTRDMPKICLKYA